MSGARTVGISNLYTDLKLAFWVERMVQLTRQMYEVVGGREFSTQTSVPQGIVWGELEFINSGFAAGDGDRAEHP